MRNRYFPLALLLLAHLRGLTGPGPNHRQKSCTEGLPVRNVRYLALYPDAFNPAQRTGYNQTQARNWIVWLKKTTSVDGFHWDAVKHFSYNTQQDLSSNLNLTLAF